MLKGWKLCVGIGLLVLSLIVPLLGFWVATLPLPVATKGIIIGILSVGGPEVLAIAAVSLLGKEAFDWLRSRLMSSLKELAPRGSVSRLRYRIGLLLFLSSVVPSYIVSYAPSLVPDSSPLRFYVSMGGDLLFVISLFVLGGDFWDKLKSLFFYEARAQFPPNQPNNNN